VKADWHQMALLWRSQLPAEGFTALVTMLDVHREWRGNDRELRITPAGPDPDLSIDPYWTYGYSPDSRERGSGTGRGWCGWSNRDVEALRRQERFLCGHDEDVLLHAVEPLIAARICDALTGFGGYWPDRAPSAANTLLTLLLMSPDEEPDRLLAAYHACLVTSAIAYGPHDQLDLDAIVLRRLAVDLSRLPDTAVIDMFSELQGITAKYPDRLRGLFELVTEILPPEMLPVTFRTAGSAARFSDPAGDDKHREEDDGTVAGEIGT